MSKKKKWLCIMLCCVCLLSISCGSEEVKESSDIVIDGVLMTADEFKGNFGVPVEERVDTAENFKICNLRVSDIVISGEDINFKLYLKTEDNETEFQANGKLGASYKTQQEINSTVIVVSEEVEGWEILLFELFNDTKDDNLLIEDHLNGKKHMKIYMQDDKDNVYLFEGKLNKNFAEIDANNYSEADKNHDVFWASDLVEHTISN